MIQATVKRGVAALALGLALAFSFSYSMSPQRVVASPYGQEAPNQTAEQTMEQKYKNIQALKGLPASQMRPMMNYISASLGMGCADCHVRTNGHANCTYFGYSNKHTRPINHTHRRAIGHANPSPNCHPGCNSLRRAARQDRSPAAA